VVVKTLQEDPPTLKSYPGTPSAATDWAHRSSHFKKVIGACLKRDPAARKKVAEILKLQFVRPHKSSGSDHAAALKSLAEAVGAIDVSHVTHTTEGIKDEEAIKKHIMATGTGRSIVVSKDTDWDFGDVDDFADDFAKEMGGLSTIEEQPSGGGESKAEAEAEAKRKAEEEAAAAIAAATAAAEAARKEKAEAAAKAQAEAEKAAEAAARAQAVAQKAAEDAEAAAAAAAAATTAAAEATAVSSSNPDDFGDFFEASTNSDNI
jgi:hypothetical protein